MATKMSSYHHSGLQCEWNLPSTGNFNLQIFLGPGDDDLVVRIIDVVESTRCRRNQQTRPWSEPYRGMAMVYCLSLRWHKVQCLCVLLDTCATNRDRCLSRFWIVVYIIVGRIWSKESRREVLKDGWVCRVVGWHCRDANVSFIFAASR